MQTLQQLFAACALMKSIFVFDAEHKKVVEDSVQ